MMMHGDVRCMMLQLQHYHYHHVLKSNIFSNMAVALCLPTLNLAMHPRAGRDQHNQPPLGRFGFSLRVTATMADGASPAHTVRVIMAFSKQPLLGGDE